MNIFTRIKHRFIWNKLWKARRGETTCNTCQFYKSCSKTDVPGEYFAFGAKHDGSRACKYYEANKD